MSIALSVRRVAKHRDPDEQVKVFDKKKVVCFQHAVELSQKDGWQIFTEVDQFSETPRDMRTKYCEAEDCTNSAID